MQYGLTGATHTCQRALDHVLKSCKGCVDNYVDDLVVFSDDMDSHISDLRQVLMKLRAAGFTLQYVDRSVFLVAPKLYTLALSTPQQAWHPPHRRPKQSKIGRHPLAART